MTRTRTVVTFLLLGLLALLGAWAAFGTYGFASTYADPTASAVENLVSGASLIGFGLGLLAAVAAVAVLVAEGPLRRRVAMVAIALVVTSGLGMAAGNHYGLRAKASESSAPRPCGIDNPELDAQWQSLDHPGYFAGAEDSTDHCTHHLTVDDVARALGRYEEHLSATGWRVSGASNTQVAATRGKYEFEAVIDGEGSEPQAALLVTLRSSG